MKKKEIELELVYDIPSLIRTQEFLLKEIRGKCKDEGIIDFHEDILRILKVVKQLDISAIDGN